jgi:site-specific recombinase XerC
MGLRKLLTCPAPSTLDRRIASWCAFHRMRNLTTPFDAPLVRQARAKARKAMARPPAPKSAHPTTPEVLEKLLEVQKPGMRCMRDRGILLLWWASVGRQQSEIVSLDRQNIDLSEFETKGLAWMQLPLTKTTNRGETPRPKGCVRDS